MRKFVSVEEWLLNLPIITEEPFESDLQRAIMIKIPQIAKEEKLNLFFLAQVTTITARRQTIFDPGRFYVSLRFNAPEPGQFMFEIVDQKGTLVLNREKKFDNHGIKA